MASTLGIKIKAIALAGMALFGAKDVAAQNTDCMTPAETDTMVSYAVTGADIPDALETKYLASKDVKECQGATFTLADQEVAQVRPDNVDSIIDSLREHANGGQKFEGEDFVRGLAVASSFGNVDEVSEKDKADACKAVEFLQDKMDFLKNGAGDMTAKEIMQEVGKIDGYRADLKEAKKDCGISR